MVSPPVLIGTGARINFCVGMRRLNIGALLFRRPAHSRAKIVMHKYEYRVIPAPIKGRKSKGVRSTSERFANALQMIMNEQAEDGWQYLRTDTLPCEERQGLTRRNTVYQNMLVFSRQVPLEDSASDALPLTLAIDPVPETVTPEPADNGADVETDTAEVPVENSQDAGEKSDTPRLGGVVRAD